MEESVFRRGVAEFVGTFTLIFIGGGAGAISGNDIVAVALANGLAIGIMVSNFGHISGGLFNPAITLGFLSTRRLTPRLAGVYGSGQFGGPLMAAGILRWIVHKPAFNGAIPSVHAIGAGRGFVLEAIMAFFLVTPVFAAAG